ncbi:MAG: ectoine hydroxylase-related dioxygenase (phytanoyl-CoA dioxygenase family) [Candidatus Latescibacterota bacterium]|jgi:ectoine hydroxylase-related dioxygenase (phytanoyl-CoA dioxygenase family)
MDRDAMSKEENYCFDIAGYLHIPGVLSPGEVNALNRALDEGGQADGMLGWSAGLRDPFRDLLVQPQLVWYLNQIISHGFRLDRQPELLCDETYDVTAPLVGGNEPRIPARAYYFQNGRRYCQAVRAIWALADVEEGDGGFVLVPCTHKVNVETPDDVATGEDDMGLTFQPAMKAGDLFLVAGTVLQGVRPWQGAGPQRLLSYEYVGRGAMQSAGTGPMVQEDPSPEWHEEITPEQRASLYRPDYAYSTPPPVIVTDGKTVKVDDTRKVFHPAFYSRDKSSGIDEKEFYFWELNGYLVLRGVMDSAWLQAANEAVDTFEDKIVVGEELSRGFEALAGTGRPTLGGLLTLPDPYCEPFRQMVSHPVVQHRINWMGGSGARMSGPTAFCSVQGTSGHSLHDSGEPMYPPMGYQFQNGRSYSEAVTVTWQLRDVAPDMGGFACVPGAHKAKYEMPPGVRACDDHMGLVKQLVMKAGDVLFFADGAMTHGTTAWKNPIPRRGVLIKYSSRSFHRSGGEMAHPWNRWGDDLVAGMTDAQLAVMRGTDRDARQVNVPRLEVTDGKVDVSYARGSALYSGDAPEKPVVDVMNERADHLKGE